MQRAERLWKIRHPQRSEGSPNAARRRFKGDPHYTQDNVAMTH